MTVLRHLPMLALLLAGAIHLLPLSGVLGADALQRLYGIAVEGPDLTLLLRHRAVLFGLLGGFLVAAAFRPVWRTAGLLAGLASVLAFLLLAWLEPGWGPAIRRVVVADLVVLAALLAGLLVNVIGARQRAT